MQIEAIAPPTRQERREARRRTRVSATFELGERTLLLDTKRRRYLVELKEGGEFHSHAGFVAHSDIVGAPEGVVVRSTKGAEYTVLRPTLEDFVVEMPRGAQVIYPKDLAPICMLADIGPGIRVFESGVGSGALSMTMLRWGAEIVGYEIREDFANRARSNVRSFLGADALTRYDVRAASSYDGIDPADGPFDRVVLDLPEPWQVVPHAELVLRAGGILVAYTPSITQAAQTREQLKGRWIDARTTRSVAPRLAHRRPSGASRPPHGGPHRLPVGRPLPGPRIKEPTGRGRTGSIRSRFDVDALAGAFLGAFDDRIELAVGDLGEPLGALQVALGGGVDLVAFPDVGESVVEQREHVGGDLFAQPVAGAQILVDPDLHRRVSFGAD